MDIEAIAARVWPGEQTSADVLGRGFTHHNFKVEVGGESFVLRVAGPDAALLGIDRRIEHQASLAAAAVGIGPEVVGFVEPEGYLVTRFIEGTVGPVERMREVESIRRVARALKAVHRGPSLGRRFNAFRVVEEYRSTAYAREVAIPPAYVWARQMARRIERSRGVFAERPCHNDLLNDNLIDDGRRIRIVDWEYAGMGDVFFDLASFSTNHGLDADQRHALLADYAGEVRAADERALELMLFMSDFRDAMWGVVQGAVSDLDFDFSSYADEHFERLEATAASAAFIAALDS